jgi:hypothetical protein
MGIFLRAAYGEIVSVTRCLPTSNGAIRLMEGIITLRVRVTGVRWPGILWG